MSAAASVRGASLAAIAGLALAIVLLAGLLPGRALAQPAVDAQPLAFASAAEEARFHALVARLRCVMCQNQSLADSNAQIAHDLRREVLAQMHRGSSDAEIEAFLVARYGEFVLYRPRVEPRTWALWFGPALLVVAGIGVLVVVVRRRSRAAVPMAPDDGQEW